MSTRQIRNNSSIINIRTFHNWVKTSLIKEAIEYLNKTYNVKDISLLDLAVGRGGDLYKWHKSGIMKVTGFDINEESIKGKNGAIHRYKKLRNSLQRQNKPIPKYDFHVTDLSDSTNLPFINRKINNRKYDIVSCQFAIHYFFRTEETLETFISIVSDNIKTNGFFIGTTMNGDMILQELDGANEIGNSIYQIKSTESTYDDNLYNRKYIVQLGERNEDHYFANQSSTEYIVSINLLKEVCKKHGLMFIGVTGFNDLYNKYLETTPDKILTSDDEEFSFLNFSFIFTKKN